jgi:Kef-type K+ transport system membrane component KefB
MLIKEMVKIMLFCLLAWTPGRFIIGGVARFVYKTSSREIQLLCSFGACFAMIQVRHNMSNE